MPLFPVPVYLARCTGGQRHSRRAGTAVVICPVGSLTYKGARTTFCDGKVGSVCQALYDALTNIQTRQAEDKHGWTVELSKMDDVISAAE